MANAEHGRSTAGSYPEVDIVAEAKKARVWVLAKRRKTAKGMFRFLLGWMGKANDGFRGNGRSATETLQEQNERAIEEGTPDRGRT